MIKKFFISLLILFCVFCLSGCQSKKTLILFNNYPITKENLLNNSTEFNVDKRIYYIFLTDKKLDTEMVRVKVYKREPKVDCAVTNVVLTVDFKLRKDQLYYCEDYLVMHQAGYYYMAFFAMNDMQKPLATADFRVK